jgi:hypothetical protein
MGCDENNCETREDVKKGPENPEVLDKEVLNKEESINMDIDPFPQQSCPPTIIIPKKK